ncbi:hypothetical protein [Pseudoxanthomonas composti]|nr:hypothetical protein [Pseudoxanthomonas composti]
MQLFAALAANLALYYALVKGLSFSEFKMETATAHLSALLPGGLAVALCGILNSQLTYLQKARIVFLRWRDPLPGCRAFSHYVAKDPRIDMKAVRAKWSPLPKGAQQQNALWYRIYQQEQGTEAVNHLNRHWLFARDYASICVLLLIALGALGIYQMPSALSWFVFVGIVLTQFFFARRSAVNHAERFILTVIAQAAAKPN